jgi:NADPH:quinone reductase-like Zn-dependent oxidoreductase
MSEGFDKIVARQFGGPEVLELERIAVLPEPGEGEVRVRVEAAGVGYTDTILRRGKYVDYKAGLPLTPGYDFAGIVDKLGAGVTGLRIGQRVADMPMYGSYTQYIIRRAEQLCAVPEGIDAVAAVEIPLMWMTAWQMLTRSVTLPAGSTILVVGASGSVGRALVILACHLGLNVVGTCSAKNFSGVEALGARVVDYRDPDLTASIKREAGGGVAAAFDAIGGDSWGTCWKALDKGGQLIGYGLQGFLEEGGSALVALSSFARLLFVWKLAGKIDGSGRGTSFYNILQRRVSHPQDYRQDMDELFRLMTMGVLPSQKAETLPLSMAAEAHRRIAAGGLTHRLVLTP